MQYYVEIFLGKQNLQMQRQNSLFESAIDLLSYYDLYGKKAGNYLSVSGVYQPNKKDAAFTIPAAISYFLLHNPNTKKIHIRMCNAILERSLIVQENYESLKKTQVKEVREHESARRSSGTNRKHGDQRDRERC